LIVTNIVTVGIKVNLLIFRSLERDYVFSLPQHWVACSSDSDDDEKDKKKKKKKEKKNKKVIITLTLTQYTNPVFVLPVTVCLKNPSTVRCGPASCAVYTHCKPTSTEPLVECKLVLLPIT